MAGPSTAQARWELENDVVHADHLLKYNEAEQFAVQQQKPWLKDPHYFTSVKMSALALLKIAMHASSGGQYEVMGMIQGKVVDNTFVVVDSYALPVQGTETRVNAQEEAYEYLIEFMTACKEVHRNEHVIGWYHSHPGYGCWLSGIDVTTQKMNQQGQDPFLAIVIDPVKTQATGKVEIGAFRTYPNDYKPRDEEQSYQTVPLDKVEDFGVHCRMYYSLALSFFKTSTDAHLLNLLWNKYWASTLSSSPLITQGDFIAAQMRDIGQKLEQAESHLASSRLSRMMMDTEKRKEEGVLPKICQDMTSLMTEQVKGLSTQVIKDLLFNWSPSSGSKMET